MGGVVQQMISDVVPRRAGVGEPAQGHGERLLVLDVAGRGIRQCAAQGQRLVVMRPRRVLTAAPVGLRLGQARDARYAAEGQRDEDCPAQPGPIGEHLGVAQPDMAGDEQRHGRADGDGHRHADPLGPWRVGHPAGAASG
ncbi:hypothetical protein [uncultured Thiohalocapsa sp.]|uniref:hypothetical protein n=1 Tax=uncultured Thiohalocapsa sp. TaxID=768990 RepID=UPI0025D13315|nr:hypothetical protein [uncultured Thiohalocapsa sp.]